MIVKKEDRRVQKRCVRNGNGEVTFEHYLEAADLLGKSRLVAMVTLEPGQSIGEHTHDTDGEIYIVIKGELFGKDNDIDCVLHEGDCMWTCNGGSHSIENRSQNAAQMIAVILN